MNNFSINFNLNFNQNVQKAGITPAGDALNSQNQGMALNNGQKPAPLINQPVFSPLMYENVKMDAKEVLKYVQNILKMPETIEKFINEAASKNTKNEVVEKLINTLLDVKVLNNILNNNSKEAIDKLLQTISISLKSGIKDVGQLKEILSILTSIHHSTEISSNTLKELLLLYIPLNYQIFERNMIMPEGFEEMSEKISNSALSVMFQTINFSNVLCVLNEENNDVLIEMYTALDFPNIKFSNIIKTMAKESNINFRLDFINIKRSGTEDSEQNFKVFSNDYISSNILIIAHIIIQYVFKLDLEIGEVDPKAIKNT